MVHLQTYIKNANKRRSFARNLNYSCYGVAYVFEGLRHSIEKAAAFHWKGNGIALESRCLFIGKPRPL